MNSNVSGLWELLKDSYQQRSQMNFGAFGYYLNTKNEIKGHLKNDIVIAEYDKKGLAGFICYKEKPDEIIWHNLALRSDLKQTFTGCKLGYKLWEKLSGLNKPIYLPLLKVESEFIDWALKYGFKIVGQKNNMVYLKREQRREQT